MGYYLGHPTCDNPSDFIIRGYSDTAAEKYAEENGFTFIALADTTVATVKGDVTGDGKVNVQDVTRILRHVRKIEELYLYLI